MRADDACELLAAVRREHGHRDEFFRHLGANGLASATVVDPRTQCDVGENGCVVVDFVNGEQHRFQIMVTGHRLKWTAVVLVRSASVQRE